MATEAQLLAGLRAADAAGNTADAQHFADQIRALRAAPQAAVPSASAQPQEPTATNRIDAFTRALTQGLTFNLGDELNAAKNATIAPVLGDKASQAPGWYQRYQDNLAHERGLEKANSKEFPVTTAVGNVAGAIPLGTMMGPAKTAGEAAVQAGRIGAAYGFGQGEGDIGHRVASAAIDAPIAALTAGTISKASDIIPRIAGLFGPKAAAVPSSAGLKAAADQAYKTVDNSGMQIAPYSIGKLNADITSTLRGLGYRSAMQPKIGGALDEIADLENGAMNNGGATLQNLDIARRVAGNALSSTDKTERMMAHTIIDKIDDFAGNIGPQDVMGNVDQQALKALAQARDLWAKKSKSDVLDRLINKAKLNSQSMQSVPNGQALRTQFRQLANNERGMARFSPDEQEAIRKVAIGSPTERVARLVGKLSPDQVIPALSEMGAMGTALATGNTEAALGTGALASLGLAGKLTSNAMTGKNARIASELMRRGGPAQAQAANPTASAIQDAVMRGAPLSSLIPLSLMGQTQ